MKIFAQITKVDLQKGLVSARAQEEIPDSIGEIMDYATSKPYFQEWSEECIAATKDTGAEISKGNVRAMHGTVAAGKVVEIYYRDEEKAIDVDMKIVDPVELEKCSEGVYTGVSIGGDYIKKWPDGHFVRYTAQPGEISLVDRPMLKTARFSLVKNDGTVEETGFKPSAEKSSVDLIKVAHDSPNFLEGGPTRGYSGGKITELGEAAIREGEIRSERTEDRIKRLKKERDGLKELLGSPDQDIGTITAKISELDKKIAVEESLQRPHFTWPAS